MLAVSLENLRTGNDKTVAHCAKKSQRKWMRRLPSMTALRAFEAAARLGSMTRAATELYVTPGAISRQISSLQMDLGVSLFQGTKSRPFLTPEGDVLSRSLTVSFMEIADAVARTSSKKENVLLISCLGTLAIRWLIPRLPDFKARFPEINLQIVTHETKFGPDQKKPDIELLVLGPDELKPKNSELIFLEQAGPVLSPGLAKILDKSGSKDVLNWPLIHTATRLEAWPEWFHREGLTPNTLELTPQFEHFYFALEAALSGLGIALGFWHLVADDVSLGRLVAPFGFQPTGRSYVAVTKPNSHKSTRYFCNWLLKSAEGFKKAHPLPIAGFSGATGLVTPGA